jgi:hypothetical protein
VKTGKIPERSRSVLGRFYCINKYLKYTNLQILYKTETQKHGRDSQYSRYCTIILAAGYLLNESQHSTKHRSRAKIRKVQANHSTLLTCANIPECSTIRHLCGPVPVGKMEFCCSYRQNIWLQSKLKLKRIKNVHVFLSFYFVFRHSNVLVIS